MHGSWSSGTVEITVPAQHLSSLIIAVHSAAQIDTGTEPAPQPSPGFFAEIADYDRRFARTRLGLDHRPIAAVTIVHANFIVDVTFDVVGPSASALFVDANDESTLRLPTAVDGATIMACRTADALESCGLRSTLARRTLPPGDAWI